MSRTTIKVKNFLEHYKVADESFHVKKKNVLITIKLHIFTRKNYLVHRFPSSERQGGRQRKGTELGNLVRMSIDRRENRSKGNVLVLYVLEVYEEYLHEH